MARDTVWLNLLFTSEQHLSNTIFVFSPRLAIAQINRGKDVLRLGRGEQDGSAGT